MLSLEDTQKILDLRERMLQNIRESKPAEEGISEDDLRVALEAVRSNRTVAKAEKEKTAGRKAKKAAKAPDGTSVFDNPKFAKFKNMNLD